MKGIKRAVVFSLIMLMAVIAVLSSGLTAFVSYADDDSSDAATDSGTEILTDEVTDLDTSFYCSTYFYLLNEIDSDIPYEISSYPSSNYSDGIYKFGAVNSFDEIVGTDLEEEPSENGLYCDNEVLQSLSKVPSLEEIQSVRSDFDPSVHYIQWYVIKNIGYEMHVDGVIRTRQAVVDPTEEPSEDPGNGESKEASSGASSSASSENSGEASSSSSASSESAGSASSEAASASTSSSASVGDTEEPEISIEIETICNNPIVPDDGEAHLVGDGFKIRIIDEKEPETLTEKIYDAFGKFLRTDVLTVTASDGNGTTFKYKNREYWVSIDAAYAYVTAKDLSEKGLTIPFIFDGKEIEPENIRVGIKDAVTGMITALKSESSVEIKTKQASVDVNNVITIEAGSTVKNDDGKTLTNDSYTIVDGKLKDGHTISKVVFNGSQTGVGESCNEITSVVIVDSEGRDVSSQYVVKCQKGRLVLVDASGNDAALSYETATVTADTISNAAAGTGALAVASGSASLSSSLDPVLSNGEAASNAAAGASVMGARMSATGDLTTDLAMRLIIIIGSMLFFGTKSFLLKKVK
ncbi:MAG: hypothetical protein IJJ65_01075 [Butyrivibrio sp.]|nr:hypothetical protein [Butyrivibrio sp.]